MEEIQEVVFDDLTASPVYPRPTRKNAVLCQTPRTAAGEELPSFIKASWGATMIFYGDYYLFIEDGMVAYGSAKEQWLLMHTAVEPGFWVKTGIPTAYQATMPCKIMTLILANDGTVVPETSYVLKPGDWIVKQPGGEVQHITSEKFLKLYFSQEEAMELGLDQMDGVQFAAWAVQQVAVSP